MKIKLITCLLLSLLGLFTINCEQNFTQKYYSIHFFNKSSSGIKVYYVKPGGGKLYPDTTLPNEIPIFIEISANENKKSYLSVKYEDLFDAIPSDTLSVFMFHSDTLEKYPWNSISIHYNILKRYDLSLQDLKTGIL